MRRLWEQKSHTELLATRDHSLAHACWTNIGKDMTGLGFETHPVRAMVRRGGCGDASLPFFWAARIHASRAGLPYLLASAIVRP